MKVDRERTENSKGWDLSGLGIDWDDEEYLRSLMRKVNRKLCNDQSGKMARDMAIQLLELGALATKMGLVYAKLIGEGKM